jgi:protein phosphatase
MILTIDMGMVSSNQEVNIMNELAYGATDPGRAREKNEDSYLLLPKKGLYVVADGMGGHNAGEVASANAIKIISRYFTWKRILDLKKDQKKIREAMLQAIKKIHEGILDIAHTREDYFGMGCTLVAAFLHSNLLHTCHVGDSRAYVINSSGVNPITQDHSYVAELVQRGIMTREEARLSPLKNRLIQALGTPYPIKPDYNKCPLKDDDIVLLCSDGLWDMLSDGEIQDIVLKEKTLEKICKNLIEHANEVGGKDNITVVLMRLKASSKSKNL